jgi:hypothetical protein
MTTPEFIQRLPALREMFPQELQLEWPVVEFLRAEQQQRAATWAGLNAWRQSTVLDKNAMVFNEKIN